MRTSLILAAVLLSPTLSHGQTTGPVSTSTNARAAMTAQASQSMSATLTKDVDTRHARVGDVVKALTASDVTTLDGTRIPTGSTLTGHIMETTTLGHGSIESRLGILFDQAQLRGNQNVALHMSIVGLAQAPSESAPADQDVDAGVTSPLGATSGQGIRNTNPRNVNNRPTVGGAIGSPAGSAAPADASGDSAVTASRRTPRAASNTTATVGSTLPGIALKSSPNSGSVLVSTSDNIALRMGTPLVLMGTTAAPAR
jgi:hypothetical protein